mgnify:CR=1 FL=1
MELKRGRLGSVGKTPICSNRTFMELKLVALTQLEEGEFCSNRTFMELKHGKQL